MNTGELWVAHPLFPWIMMVLAWWVLCSTIVMLRNWVRLRKLERYNQFLQELLVEGIGNVVRQIRVIQDRIPILKPFIGIKDFTNKEEHPGESKIRTEEQPAPAIEEADESSNDDSGITLTQREDTEGASVRSEQAAKTQT